MESDTLQTAPQWFSVGELVSEDDVDCDRASFTFTITESVVHSFDDARPRTLSCVKDFVPSVNSTFLSASLRFLPRASILVCVLLGNFR